MNIRDVEVGMIYFINDDFDPPEDGKYCDYAIESIEILAKNKTQVKYCYTWERWSTTEEEEDWIDFDNISFDCFPDEVDALISYIAKCKRKVRINNNKEVKEFYNQYIKDAEAYLEVLKEEG